MLTENDLKIVGAFIYCLKKGVENAIVTENCCSSPKKVDISSVTLPFKLTGLIDGFAVALLPVGTDAPAEAAAIGRERSLARIIGEEVLHECKGHDLFKYQHFTSALMVNRNEITYRLRHYSYCVNFAMQLRCGKIELYVSAIDRAPGNGASGNAAGSVDTHHAPLTDQGSGTAARRAESACAAP